MQSNLSKLKFNKKNYETCWTVRGSAICIRPLYIASLALHLLERYPCPFLKKIIEFKDFSVFGHMEFFFPKTPKEEIVYSIMVFRLPFPAFCQTASTTGLAWPTKRRPGGTSGSTASRSWRTDPTHTGTRGSPPGIRSTVFWYKDTSSSFCNENRDVFVPQLNRSFFWNDVPCDFENDGSGNDYHALCEKDNK